VKGVPQDDLPQVPFLWTRGIAARETLHYLDRRGFDAEPLLSTAELSRAQLTQNPAGISVASQHQFLDLAATATNDPLLGLHVAAEIDLRDIGVLFYLAASCTTVADAIERLVRYAATTNEEIRPVLSRQAGQAVLILRPAIAFAGSRRQFSELIALAFSRVLRRLTNRDCAPSRIGFAHERNSELREIHRILKCPVEFMQPNDSWTFPQSIMDLPIVSEDSRLLRILETHADELLLERRTATGLRGLVEVHLLGILPSGRVQAVEVAEQLGMSERSLRRRLAEEGSSFGEVLDQLRSRLARRYLEDERVSIKQIAWLLGYSEPGAFNHAFKRWTGTSPSRARDRRRAASS